MTPKTDVVIALHTTRQYPAESYFQHCVATLRETAKDCRLILVDDACDDVGKKVIEDIAKETQSYLIRTPKQKWFTRAYNRGLRLVRTPQVVMLNADTELGPGWLEELYGVWQEFEQQSGRRCGLVGSIQSQEEPRRWAESTGKDYVTGHGWLCSMQALYEASASRGQPGWYLDETRAENIHIRSDVELCWTLNRLGWATVKSFKSAVGHHGGKSWGHNLAAIGGLTLADVED